jgi:HK97 family phage prohead protease
MREFLTEDQFKRLAKDSQSVTDKGLRKQVLDEIEKGGGKSDRSLTFTISTATVDRQSDTVSLDGWDFENYLKNPVMLWAHDYSHLPIAAASKVWKYGTKIKASVDFVPADMPVIGPFAEAVFQMYKGGFLNATSVGFLPKKWKWAEDDARPYGIDFSEQELLEFSAVPVPANPEALLEAKSTGIDIEPLREWAKSILEPAEVRTFTIAELADAIAIAKASKALPITGKRGNPALLRRELEVMQLR